MKKTLFLSAILGAALCSSAFAAVTQVTSSTTIGEVTYNGGVYTMSGTSAQFHERTFTADQASDDTTVQAGDTTTWALGFCNAANPNTGTYAYGNTLHVGSTATDQSVQTSFDAFSLGGLIVDAGSGTWSIGRNTSNTEVKFEGNGDVNLDINSSINLIGGKGVTIVDGGTWNIAEGKTLTLTSGGANIAFNDGASVTVQGGGNLAFSRSIVLNGASSLTLTDGTGIALDNLTKTSTTGGSGSGLQTATTTYTLATGTGSVSKTGTVNLLLGGETLEGATFATDNKSVSVSQFSYYVAEGDTKTLAEANTTIGEATGTVANITVDGTLSGFSTAAHTTALDIAGSGTIKVNGELQYHTAGEGHTYLNNFAGTLEIADGGILQVGSGSNVLSNNVTLKVTEGGTVKSWGSGLAHAIVLDGGDLNQAGAATSYSGTITVESSSSVTGTGAATTLSGTTNVKAGVLTTHGNVTQSGTLDMNGPQNGRFSGALVVADGTYTSTGALYVSSATDGITVKDGATFKKGQMTLTTKSGSDATITTSRTEGAAYTTGGGNSNTFKISNADLVFGSAEDATLTNALENVTVTGGKQTDEETGAVTYRTTVNGAMGEVTLKDVNLTGITRIQDTTSTLTLDNATGYMGKNTAMGNVALGQGGLHITNGFSEGVTTIADLSTVDDAKATWSFSGSYGATDDFNVTGTVSENISLEMNRANAAVTTISFSKAESATHLDGVTMTQGNLKLKADNLSADTLTMAGGVLTLQTVADTTAAAITTSALAVTNNATLTGNLVLAESATADFTDGVVTLNGTLTIGEGTTIALGTAYLEALENDGKVLLFTGVTNLIDSSILESIVVTGDFMPGHLISVDAGNGTYNIYATPEPATATLSLLALAGLMARRKRH